MDWTEFTEKILEKLDVLSEYKELGLVVTGKRPTAGGWLEARAMGRSDSRPSAAIHVGQGKLRGRYVDRAGEGFKGSLWEFAAKFFPSRFPTWRDARDHYARKVGLDAPKNGKPAKKSPLDFLPWAHHWEDLFVKRKAGIRAGAIQAVGGRLALWPPGSSSPFRVFAFPAHKTPGGSPCGHVLLATNCQPMNDLKVRMTKGSESGIIGRFQADAEIVWLVEGITDLLAIQSLLPKGHIALANAGGAAEWPRPEWAPFFRDKHVFIVRDSDIPGQSGVERWVSFLLPIARSVRNVILFQPIEEKHGKDLRDAIASGKDYQTLFRLAKSQPAFAKHDSVRNELDGKGSKDKYANNPQANGQAPHVRSTEQQALDAIQVDVLGELPDGSIEAFSLFRKKLFTIKAIKHFSYADLLQAAGDPAKLNVSESRNPEEGGRMGMSAVKNAIAMEAGRNSLSAKTSLGAGVWRVEESNDIVIVDSGRGATWNGHDLRFIDRPRIGSQVLDFALADSWCDLENLQIALQSVDGPSAYAETKELFKKWRWQQEWAPAVMAALTICSWIQTLWTWRPLVAITGSSDAGKSTLLESALAAIFGKLAFYAQKPTEAGIRQHVRNNGYIVILDELEFDQNRQRVLELCRASSRGGRVYRGTSNQKGMNFQLRHLVWIAAIESGLKREPDRNRFIGLELIKQPAGTRGRLSLPAGRGLGELGQRLLAVAIKNADRAIALADSIKSHHVHGVNGRVVETFSVPVAMIAAIHNRDEEWAKKELAKIVSSISDDGAMSDAEDLLTHILGSQFSIGGGRSVVVSEVLTEANIRSQYSTELERQGIALISDNRGPRTDSFNMIFIHPQTAQRYLLRGTRWGPDGQDIRQILKRIDGAESRQCTLGGSRLSGVAVPSERFLSAMETEEEDDLLIGEPHEETHRSDRPSEA